MKNSKIVGIFDQVNWDDVIGNLGDSENTHTPSVTAWPAWDTEEESRIGMRAVFDTWKKANFNLLAIKWTNFYVGSNYDSKLVDQMANYLNLSGVHRSWISSVDPGYMAPWHYDYDDNEHHYLEKGTPRRFTFFITKPSMGHIFILGEDYYFNNPQGTVITWDNYKEWHGGINAGLVPKYQFHLIGY